MFYDVSPKEQSKPFAYKAPFSKLMFKHLGKPQKDIRVSVYLNFQALIIGQPAKTNTGFLRKAATHPGR